MEDDLRWILACCLLRFAAFFLLFLHGPLYLEPCLNSIQPRPHQADVSESLIRQGGWQICPPRKWAILAIFLHSMQQKWDQVTQGRPMLTPIGSRTRLGPSMDPAMALQYTKHGPLYIGYIFVFYATNMGSRDSGDTLFDPHRV